MPWTWKQKQGVLYPSDIRSCTALIRHQYRRRKKRNDVVDPSPKPLGPDSQVRLRNTRNFRGRTERGPRRDRAIPFSLFTGTLKNCLKLGVAMVRGWITTVLVSWRMMHAVHVIRRWSNSNCLFSWCRIDIRIDRQCPPIYGIRPILNSFRSFYALPYSSAQFCRPARCAKYETWNLDNSRKNQPIDRSHA